MDIISLVTKPFSLAGIIVSACVGTVGLATSAWWQLVRSIIEFHVDLFWKVVIWGLGVVTLPARIPTALRRERTLEVELSEMMTQMENLIWEKKELEEKLLKTIKERKVIETVFEEIEVEHEKALSRIDLLENEMQELKEENQRLSEAQGKGLWDYKVPDDKGGSIHEGIPLGSNYGVPSWSTGYKTSGIILQDILMHGDTWGDGYKGKPQEQPLLKERNSDIFPPEVVLTDPLVNEALDRQRVAALYRSSFSAILSLLVGMIVWKAEDPCMPLVAALFSVVGMSLLSVVQFFSTIKNKPASDAVALLSINWFILGTLTSPTLPSIARMLAPQTIRLANWFATWLGFSPEF